jgi:SAM-dependent methyltransferase
MDAQTRNFYRDHLELFCCPLCGADLQLGEDRFACSSCEASFDASENIPQLFVPNEWDDSKKDVTEIVQSFYEETPFPNYDDFDSASRLITKARQGLFAKLLDDQIPSGRLVLECGCGTGQLSNFLSVANRTVFGSDLCRNSLRLGQEFKEKNQLKRVHFLQMNLFRPVFKPETFDVVISNGVLHHTSDPFLGFKTIAKLVKPGGHILIGLYHRYGRLITDTRRILFRLSGDRLKSLDPNLRAESKSDAKKRAWFMDQYKHPHESKHTIGQALKWLDATGLEFVKSLPPSVPGRSFSLEEELFAAEKPGNWLERLIVETGMFFSGSEEGGFFIIIARKPA